jgi:hypothetical protein
LQEIFGLKPISFAPYMRSLLSFIAFTGFLLSLINGSTGCANIVPPEGGPRDTLPPVITKTSPPSNTKNFTDKRITLTFDEYVDLDNVQQNLIVSPVPDNIPNVSRKLNEVTIRIRDTLEPNTTYSFNFGKSIKDVNESNIMKDFTYIFSTGPYIDSLQFGGKVILAETNEPDSTLTVMLHTTPEDSAVYHKRPRYITKLDAKGSFRFSNLPPGTYYLYAMKDEGGTHRYNPKQLFAFADSPVVVSSATPPVTLYASAAEKEAPAATPRAATAEGGRGLRGARGAAGDKRLKFGTNVGGSKQDLMEKFTFTFETPLRSFDSSKIRFATDTLFTPVTSGYSWMEDSTRKKLAFTYPWQENTLYHFIMEKDFATDTLGQQLLKADTISFLTKGKADYGELTVRFRNLDLSTNPVLQFVLNNEVVKSFPLTSATFTNSLFEPAEYSIRILSDMNKNGVWDPGNFFKNRRQPEKVVSIQRKLNVKANWKNQFEIAL